MPTYTAPYHSLQCWTLSQPKIKFHPHRPGIRKSAGVSRRMKVLFIKPGAKFQLAYHVGEVADFDAKQAAELIEAGIVKEYAEKEITEKTETKAPGKAKTAKK